MKVAFLIQAHEKPQQLARFVDRIYKYGDVFVHIDAKVDVKPFVNAVGCRAVFLSKRCNIVWGSSRHIEAYFNLVEEALKGGYDYYSLHSASDYPCRNMRDFLVFLEQNKGSEFISCSPMPENFLFRYKKICFYNIFQTRDRSTVRDKIANNVLHVLHRRFPDRKEYKGWPPFLGAFWNTITHDFAKSAYHYWRSNISLRVYAYFTMIPDEWFMQTYGQACGFGHKFSPYGDIRYIDWSTNGAHPANLTEKDYKKIVDSNAFFARKMTDDSADLLDMLDKHIGYTE